MIKVVPFAAIGLLLGLLLGGLGPRAEVRRLKRELAEAQAAPVGTGQAVALGLGGLLAARQRAEAQAAARLPPPKFETPETPPVEPLAPGAPEAAGAPANSPAQVLEAAKAAGDLRAAQFRAAFVEEAKLAPTLLAAVDATIQGMNDELAKAAEELAGTLEAKRHAMRPRDIADVGARLLDIYRNADDKLQAALDQPARAAAEKVKFDLLTQIDVGAFRRLAESMRTFDHLDTVAP